MLYLNLQELDDSINESSYDPPKWIILTDGEDVYDTRIVPSYEDLDELNAQAQAETEGELYWKCLSDSFDYNCAEQPNQRKLYAIATDAMTPLQTMYAHLYASENGLYLTEEELEIVRSRLDHVTAVLKYIQREFFSHYHGRVPYLFYELGSGLYCNANTKMVAFERMAHAGAFQRRYPDWRVAFIPTMTYSLDDVPVPDEMEMLGFQDGAV